MSHHQHPAAARGIVGAGRRQTRIQPGLPTPPPQVAARSPARRHHHAGVQRAAPASARLRRPRWPSGSWPSRRRRKSAETMRGSSAPAGARSARRSSSMPTGQVGCRRRRRCRRGASPSSGRRDFRVADAMVDQHLPLAVGVLAPDREVVAESGGFSAPSGGEAPRAAGVAEVAAAGDFGQLPAPIPAGSCSPARACHTPLRVAPGRARTRPRRRRRRRGRRRACCAPGVGGEGALGGDHVVEIAAPRPAPPAARSTPAQASRTALSKGVGDTMLVLPHAAKHSGLPFPDRRRRAMPDHRLRRPVPVPARALRRARRAGAPRRDLAGDPPRAPTRTRSPHGSAKPAPRRRCSPATPSSTAA